MATAALDRENVTVRLILSIPERIYKHYEQQAAAQSKDVDALLIERLSRCRDHTAIRPLYFDDDRRAELEQATGHMLRDPADVIAKLRNLVSLEVAGMTIALPPEVQMRLRTRVFHGETPEQVLQREVQQALERFCGLRP